MRKAITKILFSVVGFCVGATVYNMTHPNYKMVTIYAIVSVVAAFLILITHKPDANGHF